MKSLLSIFIVVTLPMTIIAQDFQGKIVYELRTNNIQQKDNRQVIMYFTQHDYLYETQSSTSFNSSTTTANGLTKSDSGKANNNRSDIIAQPGNSPTQQWYGNLNVNVVIYSTYDNNLVKYCIKDTIDVVEWKLEQDTTFVKGLHCQKASGVMKGVRYSAWYAPGIFTSSAPLQFRGLPGLLVEVTNNSNGSILSMINLEWPVAKGTERKIQSCTDGKLLSKQEFAVIRNKQNGRAFEIIEMLRKQKELEKQGSKSKLTIDQLNIKN